MAHDRTRSPYSRTSHAPVHGQVRARAGGSGRRSARRRRGRQQSLPPSLPTITVVPGPVPAPGSSGAPQSGTGYTAETPPLKANYRDGPSGRYLLDGTWLWRNDTGNVGIAAALPGQPGDRRLDQGHDPRVVERAGPELEVVQRRRRLVSQGLPAAQRGEDDDLDRPLRVGQLRGEGVAQRPRHRGATAAPTCRSSSCCRRGCCTPARRTGSSCASTTAATATTSRRRACR